MLAEKKKQAVEIPGFISEKRIYHWRGTGSKTETILYPLKPLTVADLLLSL